MWRITKTVAIAVAMKISVAAIERGDNLPTPQTPWPLVHPLPSRVPKPTNIPATTSSGTDDVIAIDGVRMSRLATDAPIGSPTTNAVASFQGGPASAIRATVATMPLTPAIRPVTRSSRLAAPPISRPPLIATRGESGAIDLAQSTLSGNLR